MEDICELQTLSKSGLTDKTGNADTSYTPSGKGEGGTITEGNGNNAGAKSSWSIWDDEDW